MHHNMDAIVGSGGIKWKEYNIAGDFYYQIVSNDTRNLLWWCKTGNHLQIHKLQL